MAENVTWIDSVGISKTQTCASDSLVLGPCDPCGLYPQCEDRFDLSNNMTLTSMKYENYEGLQVTETVIPPVTGEANILNTVLNFVSKHEDFPYVVTESGAIAFVLKHIGQGKLLNINTINATERECVREVRCDYKYNFAGAIAPVLQVNGVDNALPDLVYGTQTTSDVQAAISAGLPLSASVIVKDDAQNSVFAITINDVSIASYKLNDNPFIKCNCNTVFKP